MPPPKQKPGPKPITFSLWPLTWPEALAASMQVDPEKVKAKMKRWEAKRKRKKGES